MHISFLSSLFITILLLAAGVVLLVKRKNPDTVGGLTILVSIVSVWVAAILIQDINKSIIARDVIQSINYLCLTSAASAQLFFAISYTNRARWQTPVIYIFFLIEPILTQILFWVQPTRAIFFNAQSGAWDQVNIIYISHLLAASIFLFMDTFLNKPQTHFSRAWTILVGSMIPMFGNLLILTLLSELEIQMHLAVFSYSLAIAGFAYGKFNSNLIETTPVTRDLVVEGMDDGWMVVDHQDKIVDVNSSIEKMIGISREKIYGLPVKQILSEWPNVAQSSGSIKELEMRRTSRAQNDWQYLNLHISQLLNNSASKFGHLIVWRDITERKLADTVNQKSRDELFMLLNAISSLASRSMKLEDFLSEASYQIVYSFNSQAVAVFLTEEKESGGQTLSLKSHFGFSPDQAAVLNEKTITSNIYNWLTVNEENRPLILNGQTLPVNTPFNPGSIGFQYAAFIPLIIYTQHENSMLGCICLGRTQEPPYSQDEVIRLTTITNQIATLIESNRKKESTIAVHERQRLMRDLHDSVSQKLYGLVALTEAAQAGIEAGSAIPPLGVLTRIGESARQAVKEMRLFLYEMQPIDLKDGLVSSLQYRLAAVEGRADIKARMISDENIQLGKEKELTLYYIAQEAFNNILRHAHAKTVSANLRQTRQNVILEITDDGNGFDIKKLDNSGLGLRNMKERAALANGKINITSKIGAGTKIVVSVPKKDS